MTCVFSPVTIKYFKLYDSNLKKFTSIFLSVDLNFAPLPQNMYTDRCSGIWAKQILSFGQFWADGAAAKNFFNLP